MDEGRGGAGGAQPSPQSHRYFWVSSINMSTCHLGGPLVATGSVLKYLGTEKNAIITFSSFFFSSSTSADTFFRFNCTIT